MAPGTNPNTIKVRGIRPLELRNRYRRFEKEFTIPDNTKVDEMSSNFDKESFIIKFPKNIPDELHDPVPLETASDAKVEKNLDDQMHDQILSTTHVMVSSPKDQQGEQEAPPKVITSIDDKRVEERKEVGDRIRPESESRGHVGDNLAKLMESEGKKMDKDQPLVENVVPRMMEPKPMGFENSIMRRDKDIKEEKADEEPSFVKNVVSKSDEEPPRFLARDFESRGSSLSPPGHRDESEDEKKREERIHEPPLVEDVVSKTVGEHLPKSEVKGKEEQPEKQSVAGSAVSSTVEQHVLKSNGVTQDDTGFKEKEMEYKKEIKEPPILESAVSRIAELEMVKKKHDGGLEPFKEGTSDGSKDVKTMTMEDVNAVMAAAKKTLQLQASKLNEETQITVNIALALFDIIAAVGAYISHQSNIQRRSRN